MYKDANKKFVKKSNLTLFLWAVFLAFAVSPFYLKKLSECRFDYDLMNTLDRDELLKRMNEFVINKETICSSSKHYLSTKAVSLMGVGKFEESNLILKDLHSKFPNDPSIKKLLDMVNQNI